MCRSNSSHSLQGEASAASCGKTLFMKITPDLSRRDSHPAVVHSDFHLFKHFQIMMLAALSLVDV